MKSDKRKLSIDAAESNAGDDFHVLWAVRKSIELLNFNDDGLKALTIEGLDDSENKAIDPTGDVLLGVDTTEYYGGENFIAAKQVIVSQLKYSTRRADLKWTASRITKDSKGQAKGSVIGRLSTLFAGLLKEYGEETILDKLTIKLVSNRSASDLLLSTIADLQKHIIETKGVINIAKLKQKLSANQNDELDRILKATALKGKDIINFLKVLNLSNCGTQSRLYHKQQIIKAIGELGSNQSLNEYSQLRELVWGKMMPEQKQFNKITKEDVLYKFGISDINDLFPVSPRLGIVKNVVLREQLPEISQSILNSHNLICLHAGAGMGKSTVVTQIKDTLPNNSVCVLFDCYGNGAYDDPADKRHSHQKALLQIANELALKIGTPLLLEVNGTDDYYIREFKKRIIEATELLNKVNPSAIVAIIIDAADNSVSAAAKYHDQRCFIHDIVRMELPESCKLIITTRTERLLTLQLPEDYTDVPLRPFSIAETALFLQSYFSSLSEEAIKEFWLFTKATPRVMSYSMELPGNSIDEKMAILKPDGKSLEDLFKIRIREAIKRNGDSKTINSFLKYLSCLPSPVPVSYLKDLAQTTDYLINDISTDLWNGIIYEYDRFSFRDEDFETYIRTKYYPNESDYDHVANYLLSKVENNEYASTHLGLFLSKSNKRSELVPIVLERKYLSLPKDPVKNREVFVERTKLAMQFCTLSPPDFLKIQIVAAEAAKTNKALEEILIQRADLASAYGNIQTNQKIYFQSGNPQWFGPAHYRSAAILSRKKETQSLAEKHLIQAKKWRDYRATLPKEKFREFKLDEVDLANGAEAVLRITEDLNRCIDWIDGWRPKELLYNVASLLIDNILPDISFIKQIELTPIQSLRVDLQLLIAKNFIEINEQLPFEIDTILSYLPVLSRLKIKLSTELKESIICFAEYLLSINYERDKIVEWLSLCIVNPPSQAPHFYSTYHNGDNLEMDIYFRKEVLLSIIEGRELGMSNLYPNRLTDALSDDKVKDKKEYTDAKKDFDQMYKHLLPIYQNRAKGFLKSADKSELEKAVKNALSALDRDYEFSYRQSHRMQDAYLFMALKILDTAFYNHEDLIPIIKDGYSLKQRNNIKLYISIAWKLSKKSIFFKQVLEQLDIIDKLIPESSLPASEQIKYYADLALIASRISKEDGKYYFDKMVIASNEVDLEAHDQIRCIYYMLGENEFLSNSKLAFAYARFIEYCWDRLHGWDHFPWEQGIQGIAKLDIASTFPIMCQWDHRNVREIPDHYIEILLIALKSKYLTPEVAGGVLLINESYWKDLIEVVKQIITEFDLKGLHTNKNVFVKNFVRDLKLQCTSDRTLFLLKDFLELIENGKYLDVEVVEDFKAYCSKVEELIDRNEERHSSTYESGKDELEQKYEALIEGKSFLNVTALDELLCQAQNLRQNGYVDEVLLFKLLQNKTPGLQCVQFLNVLAELDADIIGYYHYADILSNAFDKWNSFPQVKAWKSDAFERILRKRFLSYCDHDYINVGAIKYLASIFKVSDNSLASIVRDIIPAYLGELSDRALYQLFELAVFDLGKEQKEDFIGWTLKQWNGKIKDKSYDEVFVDQYANIGSDETIAFYLRYHLGHPDKRVRWKAAHSLRRLANLGSKNIIGALLKVQNEKSNVPFQNPDYPFYWISAKLYLWIAIEQICIELPDILIEYAQTFYTELFNSNLPHTQIRNFIRSTCLALSANNQHVFTEDQLKQIKTFFHGKGQLYAKKVKNSKRESQNAKLKTRFRFDTMDTLPYWYSSLGRVFDVSSNEVAYIADKYIAEYWGYSGEVWKEDHVKNSSYELTSNRHGSAPTIENLQRYLEYHGMFCAASDLLKTNPIIANEEDSKRFEDWLGGWGKTWDKFWLSDFRDPIPPEKKYWSKTRNKDEWEWNFSLEDFEKAIGIKEPYHPGYLVVRSEATVYYGGDYESQYISSALVHPKTSFALMRTLQQANKYEYSIPLEKENPEDDSPSNDEFTMSGWIKYLDTHKKGIDDTDALFNKIDDGRLTMGTEFSEFFQLIYSEDYRFSFNEQEENISILESWNEVPGDIDKHHDLLASEGSRLFIKTDTLLAFLKKKDKALVLLCEFSRRPKEKDFDVEYSYYKQIFLIYGDGSVKTLSRDYKLGE